MSNADPNLPESDSAAQSTASESRSSDLPPLRPVSSDPLAALKTGLKYGVIGQVLLTVLGLALWVPLRATPGLWGVVVGSAIGGGFVLVTAIVVLLTARAPASQAFAILMGSWFVKMLAVLITVAVIRDMTFYDRGALVSMIVGAIVVVLGAEVWGVLRTRVPVVSLDDASNGSQK